MTASSVCTGTLGKRDTDGYSEQETNKRQPGRRIDICDQANGKGYSGGN